MFKKTLYGLEKDGTIKVWTIETTDWVDGASSYTVTHGQENGKMQIKNTIVTEGKQKRTVSEQAISEAQGKIKKQIDKGYRETKEELKELPLLAMLAGDYHKIGHRIDWANGVDLSDKLDGVRCVAKCPSIGVITLESRTGQPYILPHITRELMWYMNPGDVLDGEIYLHGYALQEITSAVKRTDPDKEVEKTYKAYNKNPSDETYAEHEEACLIQELRPKLEFIIFDIPSSKAWFERLEELQQFTADRLFGHQDKVFALNYYRVFSEGQMKAVHKRCVAHGFEGVMMRNRYGLYESGKRSADLQKYKEFMDAEFEILDVVADKDGLGVFVVKNIYADNTFTVTLGSHVERAYQLAHKEEFIGKPLTVKFQSLYKGTLIPQFPCGLIIRDYE
jgi:DNA ligase-1